MSAGLGSSASFAVCLAAGLLKLKEKLQFIAQHEMMEDLSQEGVGSGTMEEGTDCTASRSSSEVERIPEELALLLEAHSLRSSAQGSKENCTTMSVREFPSQQLSVINEWAFQCEKLLHGTPSGIDNCISCFGGVIKYSSGRMFPITK